MDSTYTLPTSDEYNGSYLNSFSVTLISVDSSLYQCAFTVENPEVLCYDNEAYQIQVGLANAVGDTGMLALSNMGIYSYCSCSTTSMDPNKMPGGSYQPSKQVFTFEAD